MILPLLAAQENGIVWINYFLGVSIGSILLVLIIELVSRITPKVSICLTCWRLGIVGLFLIPIIQMTGLLDSRANSESIYLEKPSLGIPIWQEMNPLTNEIIGSHPSFLPFFIWGMGSLVVIGFLFRRHRQWVAFRNRMIPWESLELRQRISQVAQRLHFHQQIRIRRTSSSISPCVYGIFRPVFVVPDDFEEQFTPSQQEAIIAHELGHLANRDPLWEYIANLLWIWMWWNPLVWRTRKQHRRVCELSADEATFPLEDGPGQLAESLYLLAKRMTQTLTPMTAVMGSGLSSGLAHRVQHLLTQKRDPSSVPSRLRRKIEGFILGIGIGVMVLGGMSFANTQNPSNNSSLIKQLWNSFDPTGKTIDPTREEEQSPILFSGLPEEQTPQRMKMVPVRISGEGKIVELLGPEVKPGSDEEIFDQLNLSTDQRAKLKTLQQETKAASQEMYKMKKGQIARGREINQTWVSGLRSVLSEDQWNRYQEYWKNKPSVAVLVPPPSE